MTIFIVEDNENAREALAGYLRLEGLDVLEFGLIGDARRQLEKNEPDLLILDVMLPDGDGFMFAKNLKTGRDVPILFLTARDQESDRITGLELGADDYVVKPFSPREVVLRVKRILKRSMAQADPVGPLRFVLLGSQLELDAPSHVATVDGSSIELTRVEWNILEYLATHAPQVFSRLQILEACLGSIAEGSERTVDTHVKNLRRKLGTQEWIDTVRGFGYRFAGKRS